MIIYAIQYKPFEQWEYITEDGQITGTPLLFESKEEAEKEAANYNTAVVVQYEEY